MYKTKTDFFGLITSLMKSAVAGGDGCNMCPRAALYLRVTVSK